MFIGWYSSCLCMSRTFINLALWPLTRLWLFALELYWKSGHSAGRVCRLLINSQYPPSIYPDTIENQKSHFGCNRVMNIPIEQHKKTVPSLKRKYQIGNNHTRHSYANLRNMRVCCLGLWYATNWALQSRVRFQLQPQLR